MACKNCKNEETHVFESNKCFLHFTKQKIMKNNLDDVKN